MKNGDEQLFINEYNSGKSFVELKKQYGWDYSIMHKWFNTNHLKDNYTGRFSQRYDIFDDHAEIYVKNKGEFVKALIDLDDVDKCKNFGIWSISKAGYIMNCATGMYLHRFVMNCPSDKEVDHIYHNLLDNRKSQLRFATSSEQKINTGLRVDNKSGHRGVSWSEERQKWVVGVKKDNVRISKRFDTYEEACHYADTIQEKMHSDYRYKLKSEV